MRQWELIPEILQPKPWRKASGPFVGISPLNPLNSQPLNPEPETLNLSPESEALNPEP